MNVAGELKRNPSAWPPFAMSFAALMLVIGYVALVGIPKVPPQDEGAPARIFQLLLFGQFPFILYSIVKLFPKNRKKALHIFALQICTALIPFIVVFFLELQ